MPVDTFLVLFVCHANLCRSPLAERLCELAHNRRFGPGDRSVSFASAGTHARPDLPIDPYSAQVLRGYGVDGSTFTSRVVTADLVCAAGLVLTAERAQRAHCATLAPARVRRIFTLREFSRLAVAVRPSGVTPAAPVGVRLRELADQAPSARSRCPAPSAAEDDLADPVHGPIEGFVACAAQIWASWAAVLARLDARPVRTGY